MDITNSTAHKTPGEISPGKNKICRQPAKRRGSMDKERLESIFADIFSSSGDSDGKTAALEYCGKFLSEGFDLSDSDLSIIINAYYDGWIAREKYDKEAKGGQS